MRSKVTMLLRLESYHCSNYICYTVLAFCVYIHRLVHAVDWFPTLLSFAEDPTIAGIFIIIISSSSSININNSSNDSNITRSVIIRTRTDRLCCLV